MKCLLYIIFLISSAHAFCVYNFTEDNAFFVRQRPRHTGGTYSSRFKHENMRPGEKQCCHYSSHDCNTTGDPNTVVELGFQASYRDIPDDFVFTVTLPAGGWVELRGSGSERAKVYVFDPQGVHYVHELQVNPKGFLLLN